jgi:proteasome lid subunit RPN8/RPN11
MEHTETAVGKWTAPECPLWIEYSTRVLDDIRLAVLDAFFSLPRGGAEIGGLLLGHRDGDRISIEDYQPLDCEHATGPSFTLSPRDQTHLAEMLSAAASGNAPNRQPVGWYHSHTRSDIFFSEIDQDIHKRFFPEPWQIALVLKPHTFEPTRAGFFFREADGSMRGAASYQEFVLEPLTPPPIPVREKNNSPAFQPLDSGVRATFTVSPPEPPEPPSVRPPKAAGRVPITREIAIEPPLTGTEAQGGQAPGELDVPGFAQLKQERSWHAIKAAMCLAAGLAAGAVGYQTREYWLPRVLIKARAVLPREPDPYLALSVSNDNGQLRIQWDHNAPAVRSALDATLEIIDGNTAPQIVRLDSAHLAQGAIGYVRENERVDVSLMATEPDGHMVKEQASFLGKLPAQEGTREDPAVRRRSDEEAQQANKAEKELQAAKIRQLEKALKAMRDQLQSEQKRRQANQSPDPAKKD